MVGLGAALLYLGSALLVIVAGEPGSVVPVVALIVLLAALDIAEVTAVVRRPTLADDAESLAADDRMRTEDARTVLAALLPVLLAWTVVAFQPALVALLLGFFGLSWAAERTRRS